MISASPMRSAAFLCTRTNAFVAVYSAVRSDSGMADVDFEGLIDVPPVTSRVRKRPSAKTIWAARR